ILFENQNYPLSRALMSEKGVGKTSTSLKRVRLPTPAQLIRSDLECETRTNLPINHCAKMLTRTLRSEAGLSAQPLQNVDKLLKI
ncbi:hypothetical protein ACS6XY_04750, partial [Streptococcus suis]